MASREHLELVTRQYSGRLISTALAVVSVDNSALLKYFRVDIEKSDSSHRILWIRCGTPFTANRQTKRGFQQSLQIRYFEELLFPPDFVDPVRNEPLSTSQDVKSFQQSQYNRSEGNPVGSIEGEFALFDFDQYEITLTDTSSIPTEPVVIAAIVIDAIQGN